MSTTDGTTAGAMAGAIAWDPPITPSLRRSAQRVQAWMDRVMAGKVSKLAHYTMPEHAIERDDVLRLVCFLLEERRPSTTRVLSHAKVVWQWGMARSWDTGQVFSIPPFVAFAESSGLEAALLVILEYLSHLDPLPMTQYTDG